MDAKVHIFGQMTIAFKGWSLASALFVSIQKTMRYRKLKLTALLTFTIPVVLALPVRDRLQSVASESTFDALLRPRFLSLAGTIGRGDLSEAGYDSVDNIINQLKQPITMNTELELNEVPLGGIDDLLDASESPRLVDSLRTSHVELSSWHNPAYTQHQDKSTSGQDPPLPPNSGMLDSMLPAKYTMQALHTQQWDKRGDAFASTGVSSGLQSYPYTGSVPQRFPKEPFFETTSQPIANQPHQNEISHGFTSVGLLHPQGMAVAAQNYLYPETERDFSSLFSHHQMDSSFASHPQSAQILPAFAGEPLLNAIAPDFVEPLNFDPAQSRQASEMLPGPRLPGIDASETVLWFAIQPLRYEHIPLAASQNPAMMEEFPIYFHEGGIRAPNRIFGAQRFVKEKPSTEFPESTNGPTTIVHRKQRGRKPDQTTSNSQADVDAILNPTTKRRKRPIEGDRSAWKRLQSYLRYHAKKHDPTFKAKRKAEWQKYYSDPANRLRKAERYKEWSRLKKGGGILVRPVNQV